MSEEQTIGLAIAILGFFHTVHGELPSAFGQKTTYTFYISLSNNALQINEKSESVRRDDRVYLKLQTCKLSGFCKVTFLLF